MVDMVLIRDYGGHTNGMSRAETSGHGRIRSVRFILSHVSLRGTPLPM